MKRRDLIKKLEDNGWEFAREGRKHTIYTKGANEEQVPRHNEVKESLAKKIIRQWGLK
jgi:mRNA interferase HicA